jgi:hypothetical protein
VNSPKTILAATCKTWQLKSKKEFLEESWRRLKHSLPSHGSLILYSRKWEPAEIPGRDISLLSEVKCSVSLLILMSHMISPFSLFFWIMLFDTGITICFFPLLYKSIQCSLHPLPINLPCVFRQLFSLPLWVLPTNFLLRLQSTD